MSTAAAPKETLPLTPEQKQVAIGVASNAKIVAAVLLALGGIQVVGGPVAVLAFEAGVFSALLTMAQGALTAFLGLVMLACSSDLYYLAEVPKYSGNHLRNAANNLKVFHQVQFGLALLLALVVVLRMAM
jgi:hypothetical protein